MKTKKQKPIKQTKAVETQPTKKRGRPKKVDIQPTKEIPVAIIKRKRRYLNAPKKAAFVPHKDGLRPGRPVGTILHGSMRYFLDGIKQNSSMILMLEGGFKSTIAKVNKSAPKPKKFETKQLILIDPQSGESMKVAQVRRIK